MKKEIKNRLEAVQFDWKPGSADNEYLERLLEKADIPHYFSFQIGHDHEVEFKLGVDPENEEKTVELLKKFQLDMGCWTIFNISGGKSESFEYEPN
ncbi:MAG: hypothetical protein ABGY96_18850 [bacterium]